MVQHALSRRLRSWRAWMTLVPAALLAGCFQDLKQSTVFPESDTTRVIQSVYSLVTWIDTVIFIFVFATAGPVIVTGVTIGAVGFTLFMMLLELLVAFLQAYIFALLTSVFIGMMQHAH